MYHTVTVTDVSELDNDFYSDFLVVDVSLAPDNKYVRMGYSSLVVVSPQFLRTTLEDDKAILLTSSKQKDSPFPDLGGTNRSDLIPDPFQISD